MKKVFRIGFKDLQIIFRDRTALIMMLVAPLVLTLAMGFVTGSFSDDDPPAERPTPDAQDRMCFGHQLHGQTRDIGDEHQDKENG